MTARGSPHSVTPEIFDSNVHTHARTSIRDPPSNILPNRTAAVAVELRAEACEAPDTVPSTYYTTRVRLWYQAIRRSHGVDGNSKSA
jgi:hypothetical protein